MMIADKLWQIAQRTGGKIEASPIFPRNQTKSLVNNMRLSSSEKENPPGLEIPQVLKAKELDKFFLKTEMMNVRKLAVRRKSLNV